jgi:hypothetical protein
LVAGGYGISTLVGAPEAHALPADGLQGYTNVKDSGATGDGTTDDRAAIQAAIDASAVDPSAGQAAVVYFPPGIYAVGSSPTGTSSLFLPSNTVILGCGSLSVVKKTTPKGAVFSYKGSSVNDVQIENIALDGGWSGIENDGSGATHVILMRGQRIFVRRVEVRKCGYLGFGIMFFGVKFGAVQQCYVHHCNRDGIHVYTESEDVLIEGNLVHDCGDDHIASAGKRVSILGNECHATATPRGAAIAARAGERVKIVGNVCRGGSRAGIEITSAGLMQDVDIVDNLILESGNLADLAAGVTPQRGRGNGSGIHLLVAVPSSTPTPGPLKRVLIRNNVISAPRNHGVLLSSANSAQALSQVAISGNVIWFDTQAAYLDPSLVPAGISCTAAEQTSDISITDNDIRGTKDAGVNVTRHADPAKSPPRRFELRNNRLVDCGTTSARKPGLLLDGVEGAAISGNRAEDTRSQATDRTQDYGLKLVNPTGVVLIVENDFARNAVGAISYSAGSPGPDRLRIRDNPGFSPWSGEVTVDAGSWSPSGNAFVRDKAVPFNVPFPTGKPPKLAVSPADDNAHSAAAVSVQPSGFTARAVYVAGSPPSASPVLHWIAEPFD